MKCRTVIRVKMMMSMSKCDEDGCLRVHKCDNNNGFEEEKQDDNVNDRKEVN